MTVVAVVGLALCGACGARAVRPASPELASVELAVVVDHSAEQIYSPFDTRFAGMSVLARMLRRIGASVSTNTRPLETLVAGFRGAGRTLVLGPALYRRYRPSELRAIDAFLRSGGGVLVLVEHDNLYSNGAFQNDLTTRYGIRARPSSAQGRGPTPRARAWPTVNVAAWRMEGVEVYLAAPLVVAPPAGALATLADAADPAESVVAASAAVGAGKLIVLGDAELLWNMTPSTGPNHAGNARFVRRLFRELLGAALPTPPARVDRFGGRGMVLFDASWEGLRPDESPSGLGRFANALHAYGLGIEHGSHAALEHGDYALVVVVAPLVEPATAQRLLRARRLLLVADGQSDLLGAGTINEILRPLLPDFDHALRARYPFDVLGRALGVAWASRTLVGRAPNRFLVHGRWDDGGSIEMARAIELQLDARMGWRALARADAVRRASPNPVPILDSERAFRGERDAVLREPPVLAAATDRVFLLAAASPLMNAHVGSPEGQALVRRILRWMGITSLPSAPDG